MPSTPLIRFLNKALHVALSPRTNPITFVFGNEGGDIDSVVSAIYTSLLLSNSWDEPSHIPVVNFPRADLRLRGDVWTMLRAYGVTEDNLLFEEELFGTSSKDTVARLVRTATAAIIAECEGNGASSSAAAAKFVNATAESFSWPNGDGATLVAANDTVLLTDHNVLRDTQRQWADKVIGIIDHHVDEAKYDASIPANTAAAKEKEAKADKTKIDSIDISTVPFFVGKRIQLVGSATSLVALLWKERYGGGSGGNTVIGDEFEKSIPCPVLLLCPLVADTGNFKNKKNTPTDEAARDYILTHIYVDAAANSDAYASARAAAAPTAAAIPSDSIAALAEIESDFSEGSPSTKRLADLLDELKDDIKGLSVPETLRRDYKRFELAGGRFSVGISAILLTKKQCRKLYAADKKAPASAAGGGEGDKDGHQGEGGAAADGNDDDESDGDNEFNTTHHSHGHHHNPRESIGYPTDAAVFLPAIADRMEANKLNLYMNMYHKKGGRELEVVYPEAVAKTFEPCWAYFLSETKADIHLTPKKKRFPDGLAAHVDRSITCNGSALRHVVYKQHNTHVSRKNFTPFLVNLFNAFFEKQKAEEEEKKGREEETIAQLKSDL